MVDEINRFDIVLVKLNPTVGSEIQNQQMRFCEAKGFLEKTRPCIIISPNEMNILKTVIVAPMTSKGFNFIFRPKIKFEDKNGLVLLDQIRAVDKTRIVKKIGEVDKNKSKEISQMLTEIFEY
ncbi:MAG: type II toxin-antitoxin system PemK/MazF family toxin [Campylobacterota bacterium]|nr:type II toxin-antitoxin system PemK/MazF family toxin [Campylobacterota bacterium]